MNANVTEYIKLFEEFKEELNSDPPLHTTLNTQLEVLDELWRSFSNKEQEVIWGQVKFQ